MPIGATLVASRGGVVVHLIDEFDDSGMNDDSRLNYVIIFPIVGGRTASP